MLDAGITANSSTSSGYEDDRLLRQQAQQRQREQRRLYGDDAYFEEEATPGRQASTVTANSAVSAVVKEPEEEEDPLDAFMATIGDSDSAPGSKAARRSGPPQREQQQRQSSKRKASSPAASQSAAPATTPAEAPSDSTAAALAATTEGAAAQREEGEEEDPLDAFMAGIEDTVKRQRGASPSQAANKPQPAAFGEEDEQESFYKALQAKRAAEAAAIAAGELPQEYDADGYPIKQRGPSREERKHVDPLPPVDHSAIEYIDICKDFYSEHEEIAALTVPESTSSRKIDAAASHPLMITMKMRSYSLTPPPPPPLSFLSSSPLLPPPPPPPLFFSCLVHTHTHMHVCPTQSVVPQYTMLRRRSGYQFGGSRCTHLLRPPPPNYSFFYKHEP